MAEAHDDDTRTPEPALSRRELLRLAGVGAAAIGIGGAGAGRAYAFAGPHRFAKRQLARELKIIQWVHFEPGYDTWLDNTYVKQWGERNDTDVTIDHVDSTELPARAAAEVATRSGHDLFQFLSPPSAFQNQTIPLNDVVQETTRKLGKMSGVAHRSTYNPRTRRYFGFADNYVPGTVVWRHDLWNDVGESPATWDHVLRAAPKLRSRGHPVGIGMSNELDSNRANVAIMLCFGAGIQDEAGRVTIDSKATRDYLSFMKSLYRQGMTDEIFGWNPASNNQLLYAGTGSLILNAVSATRTPEDLGLAFSDDLRIWPIPRGPAQRIGVEHMTGVYVIWKFSKQQELAKTFLLDQQLAYRQHFVRSRFYNFPGWTGAVEGGFEGIEKLTAADTHEPRGKYTILATIAERHTTNAGHPGFSNAAVGEILDRFLIPRMVAQVAQGKLDPAGAAKAADRELTTIFEKWRDRKLI